MRLGNILERSLREPKGKAYGSQMVRKEGLIQQERNYLKLGPKTQKNLLFA